VSSRRSVTELTGINEIISDQDVLNSIVRDTSTWLDIQVLGHQAARPLYNYGRQFVDACWTLTEQIQYQEGKWHVAASETQKCAESSLRLDEKNDLHQLQIKALSDAQVILYLSRCEILVTAPRTVQLSATRW
jgi:hypothetical protein